MTPRSRSTSSHANSRSSEKRPAVWSKTRIKSLPNCVACCRAFCACSFGGIYRMCFVTGKGWIFSQDYLLHNLHSEPRPEYGKFFLIITSSFRRSWFSRTIQKCFPCCLVISAKGMSLWNTEDLTVRWKATPKEATIEALPLHKGVSKHFSLLVYGDVVAPDKVRYINTRCHAGQIPTVPCWNGKVPYRAFIPLPVTVPLKGKRFFNPWYFAKEASGHGSFCLCLSDVAKPFGR